jgi:hypothetical protein
MTGLFGSKEDLDFTSGCVAESTPAIVLSQLFKSDRGELWMKPYVSVPCPWQSVYDEAVAAVPETRNSVDPT